MRILIAFPIIVAIALGIQETGRHLERQSAIESSLEACYDAPDTTDEECEAFADAGSIHPSAQ